MCVCVCVCVYENVKFEMCIYVKGKLKAHFFLQIFCCLYEIFYIYSK